mmetsp:Transcript_48136/g.120517  ORF Transcript_48136/g.120517 Transcript_48136/m.120517 type:complete len:246 (-) Transcript_48136:149-886(-)
MLHQHSDVSVEGHQLILIQAILLHKLHHPAFAFCATGLVGLDGQHGRAVLLVAAQAHLQLHKVRPRPGVVDRQVSEAGDRLQHHPLGCLVQRHRMVVPRCSGGGHTLQQRTKRTLPDVSLSLVSEFQQGECRSAVATPGRCIAGHRRGRVRKGRRWVAYDQHRQAGLFGMQIRVELRLQTTDLADDDLDGVASLLARNGEDLHLIVNTYNRTLFGEVSGGAEVTARGSAEDLQHVHTRHRCEPNE